MALALETRTWREQRVTLKPNTSDVIYFNDTFPNHILVSNPAGNPLYIGVNGNVNPSSFDMVVPAYGTRMYARPSGTTRFYLYSESQLPIDVQVTSWEGTFNPASVAQSQEMVGAGANGLLGIVEVNNLLSSLPSGTNHIGSVTLSDFEAPLPSGNNLIGKMEITNFPETSPDKATSLKVVAAAAGEQVVKNAPGLVYSVASDGTVQLMDGSREGWKKGDFQFSTPISCDTSIKLKFTQPGEAFILFK